MGAGIAARGAGRAEPSTAPHTPAPPLEALPVVLELARPDAGRVTAWVEGVLGWQPLDGSAGGLVPRLRLVDVPAALTAAADAGAVPTVLVVADGDAPLHVATAVGRVGPDAVVDWPDGRDELVHAVGGLLADHHPAAARAVTLRVAGAAGGVGTTTVALALGALGAWRVGHTLVLTAGVVPAEVERTVAVDTLAGPLTFDEAAPVAGVPRLRVVRCAAHPADATVDPGAARVVVCDVGVAEDADVVVLRRDRAGVDALGRSTAGVVVLLDDGVLPPSVVASAAGGRRLITLPRSARVARAGCLRRVPSALPASYLRPLRPLVPAEVRRAR